MPPPRSRSRRALRIAGWSLGGFVVLLVLVVAVGAWLLGRETTLQRIVVEAEKALNGQLRVEGVTGSIYDRVAFERLVFRTKTQVFTFEKGSLRYRLEPIARRFTIGDAHAARLTVETIGKSDVPSTEPDTLELPASLRVDTLRLDAVHLDTIDLVADGKTTSLTAADLKARYVTVGGRKRWIVERLALATPWGNVEGQVALDATRPFTIDGSLLASGTAFDVPYRAPLTIAGKLADLALASDFTLSDPAHRAVDGHADARVLPFRDQPIDHAVLHVAGVSPKRWKADLPEADLSVDASITPQVAPSGEGAGSNPFTGKVRIVNAAPGPADRDRIPVASLEADVQGDSLAIVASRLAADLGAAGRLEGRGSYRFANGGTPAFDGAVRALDLRAIHGKLIASRFSGPVKVSRIDGVVRLDTALADTGRNVALHGTFAGDKLHVDEAIVAIGTSRVAAAGNVDLARDRPFDLHGELAHFDPHAFGDFPKADVSAAFRLDGTIGAAATNRAPQAFRVRTDIRVDPSRVLDRPVVGSIAGVVAGHIPASVAKGAPPVVLDQVADAKVALAVGADRIDLDGSFGRPQDRLRWNIDAPKLADLAVGLAGSLKGQGFVGGSIDQPSVDFTIAADDLREARPSVAKTAPVANGPAAPATTGTVFALKALRAKGHLFAGASGSLDADVTVTDLRTGDAVGRAASAPTLQTAEAHVKGTRDAHTVTLLARSDRFDVSATGHGGLDAGLAWRGFVDTLQSRGRVPFSTDGPISLAAGRQRVEIGPGRLNFAEGRVDLQRLVSVDGRIETAGKASGFPLSIVGTFSRDFARQVSTDLRFGGEWDLRVGDTIDGHLRLFRESGKVRFLTEPRFDIDPEKVEVAVDVVADRVTARVAAAGRGLGRIDASIDTRLTRRNGQWGLPGDAPLALKGDVDLPDLRWLARLTGVPGLDVYGALKVAVTGKGTVAEPLLAGHASGEGIGLRWPDQGVNARDGKLDLDFDGNRIVLRQATLASGKDGRLDASGELRVANRAMSGTLNVKFDQFEAVSRTDRTMIVSGSGSAKFGPTGIDITADVKADRGSLQLAERRGPTLSNDIVIVGRETDELQAGKQAAAPSLPVRFEVRFDMGDDFNVRGSGFEGKLGGVIRIAGSGSDLRAIGTVSVREGTYEGYGQRLTIVRGNLIFSGPIDNPALDINAVRKNLAVEAGVQISGTALAPQARLISTPNVPDTEKLSWLVLGHGLAASTKSDYGLLTSAAAGLLGSSDSASIQSRIAATLGVDEIGVSGLGGDKAACSRSASRSRRGCGSRSNRVSRGPRRW